MLEQDWTIERICDVLGDPELAQRCMFEINRAPAHELLAAFAKWERLAKSTLETAARARDLRQAETETGTIPGEWTDVTNRIVGEAERARARGAA
jgi:hypothetical protein